MFTQRSNEQGYLLASFIKFKSCACYSADSSITAEVRFRHDFELKLYPQAKKSKLLCIFKKSLVLWLSTAHLCSLCLNYNLQQKYFIRPNLCLWINIQHHCEANTFIWDLTLHVYHLLQAKHQAVLLEISNRIQNLSSSHIIPCEGQLLWGVVL